MFSCQMFIVNIEDDVMLQYVECKKEILLKKYLQCSSSAQKTFTLNFLSVMLSRMFKYCIKST